MKKKQKKTLKAKKKEIQSKSNKVSKKNKKKIINNNKKIKMDNIYTIINKAQLGKSQVVFSASVDDSHTIENTIIDADIKYKKENLKTKVVFTLYPCDREEKEDALLERIELFEDEFPDEDFLF